MVTRKFLIVLLFCLLSFSGTINLFALSVTDNNVRAQAYNSDTGKLVPIQLPKDFLDQWNSMLNVKQGQITFKVPEEWDQFDEVRFTLRSADEEDTAVLMINHFFGEASIEDSSIRLPFVTDGTAVFTLDDPSSGIQMINLPSGERLTLKDFKQLLKDLKLLSDSNNNGYDLETQEAVYELLHIIDELRCTQTTAIRARVSSKKQVAGEVLKCGISTLNYQDYIAGSIKEDLPYIVFLKLIVDTLKPIGLRSPPVNLDLPDSPMLRALANADILTPLPPWAKVALWIGAYIVTTALANQKLKTDYFAQVRDNTCTRVFGAIDRRFIIGKDLNNNDIKRTNTIAGITVNGSTIKPKVIEPFPCIPNEPGIYYACLPQGTQTINLQFNEQNTFSMSVTVPAKGFQIAEPFIGGVFRKYGTDTGIGKIIESKRILDLGQGDVKSSFNLSGNGAYLTTLSLKPSIDASTNQIAEALRLYTAGTFTTGNPDSKGTLEPERANAYADLAIDTRAIFFDSNNQFPLQFVVPNTPLDFGMPGEQLHAILIDKFGEKIGVATLGRKAAKRKI